MCTIDSLNLNCVTLTKCQVNKSHMLTLSFTFLLLPLSKTYLPIIIIIVIITLIIVPMLVE